ncbi:hypothetical protein [Nevskia soli]|uniref:hypothetical protein n=1 Tax=Nevskia soli TaxID=418856 RepID=UPI0004A71943|nr:hypothetical protein [Nevskia soli]
MRRLLPLLLAALFACAPPARAGTLADVEVYDRSSGIMLPLYRHEGRLYVAGEPRHEYELRIRSHSGARLLAVGSVDGVNVLSGETAAPDQDGYVLDGYGSLAIAGWRKSLQRVAAFYFTALPDSYAARTGRPDDVGVIGVALFRERVPCCMQIGELSRDARPRAAPAPAAEAGSAAQAAPEAMDRLGTGHGRSEYSAAYETTFERDSAVPDEVISIFYDSRRKLIAQGIIAEPRLAQRSPNPFPNRFVPDP